jgi:hypothetical protein
VAGLRLFLLALVCQAWAQPPAGVPRGGPARAEAQASGHLYGKLVDSSGHGIARAAAAPPEFFFVNVDYSLVKVLFADADWVEGSGDYMKIHLKSVPKALMVRTTARAPEGELPVGKTYRDNGQYVARIF